MVHCAGTNTCAQVKCQITPLKRLGKLCMTFSETRGLKYGISKVSFESLSQNVFTIFSLAKNDMVIAKNKSIKGEGAYANFAYFLTPV